MPSVQGEPISVRGALDVRITTERVLVDGVPAALLPDRPLRSQTGFGADLKRRGVNDLLVLPIADVVSKNLRDRRSAAIYADRNTEYRILVEVLYTLGQSSIGRFVLPMGTEPGRVHGWVAHSPSKPSADGREAPAASTVFIVAKGFSVKYLGHNLLPDCANTGSGVTIPRAAGGLDDAKLADCLAKAGTLYGERARKQGSDPSYGYLAANPAVPFAELMQTVAAMHRAGVIRFSFMVAK